MARTKPQEPLRIHGLELEAGARHDIELSQSNLPSAQVLPMELVVLHGRRPGPGLWISAAIHGDELCGVEIVKRVITGIDPERLNGTLYAVPIVNTFGFLQHTRTLPDGRDLNRCFPGSTQGSLASRLANIFMTEIVARCDYGIDLHTAGSGRDNLPQVRADLDDEQTALAAQAFGAPVMVHSRLRDGSLRAAAGARGKKTLLFEGGPPQRFDDRAIAVGERGVRNVMALLRMAGGARLRRPPKPSVPVRRVSWVRSPRAGVARLKARLGDRVTAHQTLGSVSDPLGGGLKLLRAPFDGIVVGIATDPLTYQGDALLNIGRID